MTRWADRLETGRLVLRGRRPEDATLLRQLWGERDPRVPARRRLDADGLPTVEELAGQIRAEASYDGPVVLTVEERSSGRAIGYCGLFAVEGRSVDEPELAFELLAEVQGRGYATEAARAVVEHARAAGTVRLWADVWAWNRPSLRVLDKLGFEESSRTSVEGRGANLTLVLDLAEPQVGSDD
ncbi:GNAT family N-acetyltransferase [Nocardioides zeicaulis]|uniref:GNAT family N-acetyltransferase n=1 Tax=Nocardioides zeicaulis TaxID=1776857 RepID=A0ABV6E193_9ACTN